MTGTMKPTAMALVAISALAGCDYFEPAFPDPVTHAAAASLTGVSELVASAQLGNFETTASYKEAGPAYAASLAQIELARSWTDARAQRNTEQPAAKAAQLLADDLKTCAEGVQEMAALHKAAGLPRTGAYTTVRVTCAVPVNNIIQ